MPMWNEIHAFVHAKIQTGLSAVKKITATLPESIDKSAEDNNEDDPIRESEEQRAGKNI